jgi:hypothetical protein
MTTDRPEYIITEEQVLEYSTLYAEANTADFASMKKVYEVANEFEKKLRERPATTLAVLEELKNDLKTRFISTTNQWSKGRNSGLIECCNIIDELLRKSSCPGGGCDDEANCPDGCRIK